MDIIPVIDLAQGVAVWARGGVRGRYAPVESALAPEQPGDPLALMHAFRRRLGATSCYVADLDAIQGGAVQRATLLKLAELEAGFAAPILVDAGAHSVGGAVEVLACAASQVVVGLETLRSFKDLGAIVALAGADRTVFGLDLRLGHPVVHPALPTRGQRDASRIAGEAVEAGVTTLLVLDLGRVGNGGGPDLRVITDLRRRWPETRLLAGGGVRSRRDLERMQDAGCDGALVGSAVHAGTITAVELAEFAGVALGAQSPSVSR